MDAAERRHDRAAPEPFRADLAALLRVGDHLERLAEEPLLELEIAGERLVLLRGRGGDEPPAPGEVAGDLLVLDQLRHVVPGRAQLAVDGDRLRLAEGVDELPEPVLAHLADEARVARARAEPRDVRFEHRHVTAAARQRERARQARVAGADDGHVGFGGQRRGRFIGTGRRVPPPWLGAEVLGEDGVGHAAAVRRRSKEAAAPRPRRCRPAGALKRRRVAIRGSTHGP